MGIKNGVYRTLTAAACLLAVFLNVSGQSQDAPGNETPARIQGVIRDNETGQPLSGVDLRLPMQGMNVVARTDNEGRFTLSAPPGVQFLAGRKAGYLDLRPDGRTGAWEWGVPVSLASGAPAELELVMLRAPVVTGRVFDNFGRPVQNARIQPLRYVYAENGERHPVAPSIYAVQTNDRGEFRIDNLPPGDYGFSIQSPLTTASRVYYPGTPEIAHSNTVRVQPATETRLNDVVLQPPPANTLRLRISGLEASETLIQGWISQPGEPLELHRRIPLASGQGQGQGQATLTAEIPNVPPGTYDLKVVVTPSQRVVAATVHMGATDSEVALILPRVSMVTVQTRIESADAPPRPAPGVRVRFQPPSAVFDYLIANTGIGQRSETGLIDASRPLQASGNVLLTVPADADGRAPFVLPAGLSAGPYRIGVFDVPPGLYVSEVRESGRNLLPDGLEIRGGEDLTLEVILAENPGVIEGVVNDRAGVPVMAAIVALIPEDRSQRHRFIARLTDEHGRFRIESAPGAYRLYAWFNLDGAAYRNAEFMRPYDSSGVAVEVRAGEVLQPRLQVLDEHDPAPDLGGIAENVANGRTGESAAVAFALHTVFKSSIVLLAALAAISLLAARSAALRHGILATALAGAAGLPVLGLILPPLQWTYRIAGETAAPVPVAESETAVSRAADANSAAGMIAPPDSGNAGAVARSDSVGGNRRGTALGPAPPPQAGQESRAPESTGGAAGSSQPFPFWRQVDPYRVAIGIWIAGMLLGALTIVIGTLRLWRISIASEEARHDAWSAMAAAVSAGYGLKRRVRILHSPQSSLLAAWGLFRPAIVLPVAARNWDDERIRVVLAHELAHVQRFDWMVQMAAELVRVIYWFNPLVWIACRQLRRESEHACDDAVLRLGVSAPEYAAHLLDVARALQRPQSPWLPALPMAGPSGLERRFTAILNKSADRSTVTRRGRVFLVAILMAVTFPLAAFHLSAQSSTEVVAAGVGMRPLQGSRVTGSIVAAPAAVAPPPAAAGSVAGIAWQVPDAGNNDTATVAGVVVNGVTGAPIPAASISFLSESGRVMQTIDADAEGRFTASGLAPARYTVEARQSGFVRPRGPAGRVHISLASGGEIRDLRVELQPGAVIQGRVWNVDGSPASGVTVTALERHYAGNDQWLLGPVDDGELGSRRITFGAEGRIELAWPYAPAVASSSVRTDAAGEYRLYGLQAGEYNLAVSPSPGTHPIYYPGVYDPTTAVRIVVAPGVERSGMDVRQPPQETYTVRIRVPDPGNCNRPTVRHSFHIVRRISPELSVTELYSPANVPLFRRAEEDIWISPGLVPGLYDVFYGYCSVAWSGVTAAGRMTVTVIDRDVDAGVMDVQQAHVLEGILNGIESLPEELRFRNFALSLFPTDGRSQQLLPGLGDSRFLRFPGSGLGPTVLAGNRFSILDLPAGHYMFGVIDLPRGVYLESARYGGREVRGTGLVIDGEPVGPLELTFAGPGGVITGLTRTAAGEAAAGSRVALIPPLELRANPLEYKVVDADRDGRFTFSSLAPGEYILLAWDDLPEGIYWTAAFLRDFQAYAVDVNVGAGGTAAATVRVIPAQR